MMGCSHKDEVWRTAKCGAGHGFSRIAGGKWKISRMMASAVLVNKYRPQNRLTVRAFAHLFTQEKIKN